MGIVLKTMIKLLQDSLWGTQRELDVILDAYQWVRFFELVQEQALDGIIMDGIAALPKEQRPPINIRLRAIAAQQMVEKINEKMNLELVAMIKLLDERGLQVVLLKGQGAAANYRFPLHRLPGDIDLFVPNDFEAVCDVMRELGAAQGRVTPEQHIEFDYHGLVWEIHNRLSDMCHPASRKFISTAYPDVYDYVTIEDCKVPVWGAEFNAAYMVAHIIHHVYSEGVGTRQLCDWVTLLHRHHATMDIGKLEFYLKKLHLKRPFNVLGVIAVRHLGLPPEEFPFRLTKKEKRIAKKVWWDILNQGNFGRAAKFFTSDESHTRFSNYCHVFKRCVRLYGFCPSEAGWRPFMKVVRFFQRGMD